MQRRGLVHSAGILANQSGTALTSLAPEEQTIFSLSSGAGKAGVAVVRVSGQHARTAVATLSAPKQMPPDHRAGLRILRDPVSAAALDSAVVLRFDGPGSFTGEDVVELHLHGGRGVVRAVLEALGRLENLRPAAAGEFTRRAFMNSKLDLTQVEAVAELIAAETEAQRLLALRGLGGDASRLYDGWRVKLLRAIAHVEGFIDFGEDDEIEPEVLVEAMAVVKSLKTEMEAHLAAGVAGERVRQGVQVAIVGEPNVGKSSLLNLLSRRVRCAFSGSNPHTRMALVPRSCSLEAHACV
jgi:tRNA modification GTPase